MCLVKIGIIGDYNGCPSHLATNEAISHSARSLSIQADAVWVPTEGLEQNTFAKLDDFDALWCAPGSPYKSMNGAVAGIQFAREHDYPFIGTCGGFQHAVVEYARNILKIEELQRADFDLYAPNSVITPLTCSLMGLTGGINIVGGTKVSTIYGDVRTQEKYTCNFGVSENIKEKLNGSGLRVVGTDDNDEARIVELGDKTFFIATLFQPQLISTPEHPHPLILAYLRAALAFHNGRQN